MWKQYLKAAVLIAVAGIIQYALMRHMETVRGYWALGGEFFLFPIIVGTGYWLLGLDEEIEEDEYVARKKRRNQRKRSRTSR